MDCPPDSQVLAGVRTGALDTLHIGFCERSRSFAADSWKEVEIDGGGSDRNRTMVPFTSNVLYRDGTIGTVQFCCLIVDIELVRFNKFSSVRLHLKCSYVCVCVWFSQSVESFQFLN